MNYFKVIVVIGRVKVVMTIVFNKFMNKFCYLAGENQQRFSEEKGNE